MEEIVKNINCSAIISTISRLKSDLNRPINLCNKEAVLEYRSTLELILEHLNLLKKEDGLSKPYLHLAIHGMKDRDFEIEIGTLYGKLCSPEIKKWFIEKINQYKRRMAIDKTFIGDPALLVYRNGEKYGTFNYQGYGNNYNLFQIEICRTLREKFLPEIVDILSDIIISFNKEFT